MRVIQPGQSPEQPQKPAAASGKTQGQPEGLRRSNVFSRFKLSKPANGDSVEIKDKKPKKKKSGIKKAFKYFMIGGAISAALAAGQIMLAPFSAGISLLTACATLFLGPPAFGILGFIKGKLFG